MYATIIDVDGKVSYAEPSNGTNFSLAELQGFIDGGYIEIAPQTTFVNHHVIVDEEGLLKKLPLNWKATHLVGYPLVGKVVLVPRKALEED